jgi:primosomal replication protein N
MQYRNGVWIRGVVASQPTQEQTSDGKKRTVFVLNSGKPENPLRVPVVGYGRKGEAVKALSVGSEVVIDGFLVAGFKIFANSIEVLKQTEADLGRPGTEQTHDPLAVLRTGAAAVAPEVQS